MSRASLVRSLSLPLPEDILKRKWSGDFAGCLRAIDAQLANPNLPTMLRERLTVEKERLRRLPTQYPYDRNQALEKLREKIPDLTEAEFDAWEDCGYYDWISLGSEKRYFVRNAPSLMTRADVRERAGQPFQPGKPYLDEMIAAIKTKGKLSRRITIKGELYMVDDAFVPGEYRAWLPFPAASAQQRDIRLLSGTPNVISAEDAPARTAFWQRRLEKPERFEISFSYVSTIRYADPLHAPAPQQPLYPDAPAPTAADVAEEPPFIRFTPYLKALAAEITAGAETPTEKAWRIYAFVTEKVRYSFVRDYFQIDNIGEFCALNMKGDCGLQALTFIQLCRIVGIPARWQSGNCIDEDGVGAHDWAQFWLDGWGWLFADPSFGGSAWRAGSMERQQFYFGNLDPMRMVANRVFEAEFDPAGEALRYDPYDNQSGEIERIGAEVPLTGREIDCDWTLVSLEEVD